LYPVSSVDATEPEGGRLPSLLSPRRA